MLNLIYGTHSRRFCSLIADVFVSVTVSGLLSRCCPCTNVLVDPGSRSGNWVPSRWDSVTIRSCSTAPWRDLPSARVLLKYDPLSKFTHFRALTLINQINTMLFLPSLTGFWKYKQLYMDGLAANHGKTRQRDLHFLLSMYLGHMELRTWLA